MTLQCELNNKERRHQSCCCLSTSDKAAVISYEEIWSLLLMNSACWEDELYPGTVHSMLCGFMVQSYHDSQWCLVTRCKYMGSTTKTSHRRAPLARLGSPWVWGYQWFSFRDKQTNGYAKSIYTCFNFRGKKNAAAVLDAVLEPNPERRTIMPSFRFLSAFDWAM